MGLSTVQALENALDIFMEKKTLTILENISNLETRLNQMEQNYQKNYLQQKEVCQEFGIGHRTLKQWVKNGLSEIWLDNRVYYDRRDLEAYLETHKI